MNKIYEIDIYISIEQLWDRLDDGMSNFCIEYDFEYILIGLNIL